MTQRPPDIRRVTARLQGLRRRIRALYALHGIARVAMLVAGIVASTYLLDRLLVLPQSVRMLLFFGSVASILFVAARHLVYPLRKKLDEIDLAAALERTLPDLRDRLVSAIELHRALEDPQYAESRSLAIRAIETTLDAIEPVRFRRALAPGGVHRWAALALVTALGLAAWAATDPIYARTWFRRMVALQDVQWPRETFLEVILPTQARNMFIEREGDRDVLTIAAGEDLSIRVKANGRVPRRVAITYDTLASDRASARAIETRLMTKTGPRDFQYSFLAVTDSFEFFVRGGDDQSGRPVYKVRVLPPPRVEALALHCTYPPYTGLPPATLEGGSFEAPAGTRIALQLTSNLDLERAFLSVGEETVALERGDATTYRGSLLVDRDLVLSFLLHGANGLRNTTPVRFRVRAIPDLPPSVQLFGTASLDFDATPEAAVPIRILSNDDYGVSAVRWFARAGMDDQAAAVEIPLASDSHLPAGDTTDDGNLDFPVTTKVLTVALLDLPALPLPGVQLPLEPGDLLVCYAEASDTHTDPDGAPLPQKKETQPLRIHIVQRAELERKLNDWQVRLKSRVVEMRDSQRSIRDELSELLELDAGDDRLSAADAQAVLDAEIDQNRVTNESKQIGTEFRQIFNTYLYNRLEMSPLTEKLIAGLQASARRFDVDEISRYRMLFASTSVPERQRSDILGKQLTMMELMLSVSEELSPQATEHLLAGRKSIDGGERIRLVREALARQDAILESLMSLLEKMDEWEDFQEVLQETKDLIELQKTLRSRTQREIEAEREERDAPAPK